MGLRKQEIQAIIRSVQNRVNAEISATARDGGIYGAGLASEGYNGGYRDALSDLTLLLNNVWPNNRRGWWDEAEEQAIQAVIEFEARRKRKRI